MLIERWRVHCLQAKVKGKRTYLHRLLQVNPSDHLVDHIDRDGLNNCRFNLRLATNKQNIENQGIRADNWTGYRGVDYHRSSGRFPARVRHHGREHHLGMFKTAEQANAAAVAVRQRLGYRASTPNR
ncbi:MAG: AP2 domain-containing protein [Planctomycetota bacterium]